MKEWFLSLTIPENCCIFSVSKGAFMHALPWGTGGK